jgi:hypothetical protein
MGYQIFILRYGDQILSKLNCFLVVEKGFQDYHNKLGSHSQNINVIKNLYGFDRLGMKHQNNS